MSTCRYLRCDYADSSSSNDQLDNILTSKQEFLQIRKPRRELLQRECVGGRSSSREEAEEEEGGCGGQQQGGDHVDHDDGEMSMK